MTTIPERIEQLTQQEARLTNLVTLKREELRRAELGLADVVGRRMELQSIELTRSKGGDGKRNAKKAGPAN